MDDIRENFKKQAEQRNKEVRAWEEKIEIVYNRADQNLQNGVNYADSLIQFDNRLDKWRKSDLHTIVGELYYDHDSIDLALIRFYRDQALTLDSPRNKGNKAGCYVKLGDFKKAMTLLEEAAETNSDFKWYIGNLYEIKGEPEKAISEYQFLYERDTLIYSYCKQRIKELKTNPGELMHELYYKDRRKRTVLLLQGIDSDTSDSTIGTLKIEKINNK
jgi:tetratricopeptide (TPR) repeat protein